MMFQNDGALNTSFKKKNPINNTPSDLRVVKINNWIVCQVTKEAEEDEKKKESETTKGPKT